MSLSVLLTGSQMILQRDNFILVLEIKENMTYVLVLHKEAGLVPLFFSVYVTARSYHHGTQC